MQHNKNIKPGNDNDELVAWSFYHDGGSPLVGTYQFGAYTQVLELDKDFTVGEALVMVDKFNQQAIRDFNVSEADYANA